MHNTFSNFKVTSFGQLPGHHQTYAFILNMWKSQKNLW